MVVVTVRTGSAGGDVAGTPSWLAGFVRPAPVPYRVTTSPALAGWSGPLIDPCPLNATAWPVVLLFNEEHAGAAAAALTVSPADTCPWLPTTTSALSPVRLNGATTPTCPADVKRIGAGVPLK